MASRVDNHGEQPDPHERGHLAHIIHSEQNADGTLRRVYAPEIIVFADDRPRAQRAVNLIAATYSLERGWDLSEHLAALPDDGADLEDLTEQTYETLRGSGYSTAGIARSVAIAAKATTRNRWTYAISRLWLSHRTCSVDWIELHPRYGQTFHVDNNPLNHVMFASAIINAFSAIEELDLHVKASREQPSRINGAWNPPVLADLQSRLGAAGIDLNDRFPWHLRGTPSRIEREHSPPAGERASWSSYSVRDRLVDVADAIQYASLLRSRVSAHRVSSRTRSLTIYDVANVQMLARRLILESMEYWMRWHG